MCKGQATVGEGCCPSAKQHDEAVKQIEMMESVIAGNYSFGQQGMIDPKAALACVNGKINRIRSSLYDLYPIVASIYKLDPSFESYVAWQMVHKMICPQ